MENESVRLFLESIISDIDKKISRYEIYKSITDYFLENSENVELKNLIMSIVERNNQELVLDDILAEYIENNNASVSESQATKIINQKIEESLKNNVSSPFVNAYWKDSKNGNMYYVDINNAELNVKQV